MAKYYFTKEVFEQIAFLLKNRVSEDRNKQKTTRAKIRRLGFMISDYHTGFTEREFRELERKGEIQIIGATSNIDTVASIPKQEREKRFFKKKIRTQKKIVRADC